MANVFYNNGKKNLLNGTIDLDTNTIKIMLVTSSYTPNADSHDFKDDITNEVSGTGYTAGGATLAGCAVTADTTNDRGKFDANDVVWSTATITARGAVIYKDTGTASTSPIIGYIDFTTDKTATAGDFTIQFNADGVLYI